MKIKTDFVTNSSSCSYTMWWPGEDKEGISKIFNEISNDPDGFNEGVYYNIFSTIRELDFYTNGEKDVDWAQKPKGPSFEFISEGTYHQLKKLIEDGDLAIEARIDWNIEVEKYIPNEYIIGVD